MTRPLARKIADFVRMHPVLSVIALAGICLAPVMAMRDFSPGNELRYLSIADEAIRDSHIFAFYNHGAIYADKPPLYLWLVMLCRLLAGRHVMWLLSLFSLVPAMVIAAVMDRWFCAGSGSAPRVEERAAAAMMLCSTGMFLGLSIFLRMDMLMSMWIVLALYSFRLEKPGMFALCTFLALFTKGPVGLLMPPVSVLAFLLYRHRSSELPRWFGWRFWAILGGTCALWFAGVYVDGGVPYLQNLLVHQTVGRAVDSFYHKAPVWYYLAVVWGDLAPWCLLAVPLAAISTCALWRRRSDVSDDEALWTIIILVTVVMLSAFSSKLAIYLVPLIPFFVYAAVKVLVRNPLRGWMRLVTALPCALLALIGLGTVAAALLWKHIPALEAFAFVRSVRAVLGGALLCAGGTTALCQARESWTRPVLTMGVTMYLTILLLSPLVPAINPLVGFGPMCEDISRYEQEHGAALVQTFEVGRSQGMEVYLGHEVVVLDHEAMDISQALSLPGMLVVPVRMQPQVEASGRRAVRYGMYYLVY